MSKKHESNILNNLRSASFKTKSLKPIHEKVTTMTVSSNLIFLGSNSCNCFVYRYQSSQLEFIQKFNISNTADLVSTQKSTNTNITEMIAFGNYLLYLLEENNGCTLCLHRISEVVEGTFIPVKSLQLCQKAPLIVEPSLGLIAIGGAAWLPMSWADSSEKPSKKSPEFDESWVCSLSLPDLEEIHEWKCVNNSVALLRIQLRNSESLLGVADSRTGLKVYDLLHKKPASKDYTILYEVPAEEIRTFELVGEFVAIFHKFEANVSLWHMRQQRTILCINIQDQMRELALADDDDDCGLCRDEDDSVTVASSVALDGDHLLIYGTRSGTLSGMSVVNRCKLFTIPCPNQDTQNMETSESMETNDGISSSKMEKNDVQQVCFMQPGMLVAYYEKFGLSVLDFTG